MSEDSTPSDPPAPWRLVAEIAVGGLHSIGFVPQTEDVLVVSQNGRGLLRGATGRRLARDLDASWKWYAADSIRAMGIGEHDGVWVPVAGLDGGSLSTATADGWTLVLTNPDQLSLVPPKGKPVSFAPRGKGEALRAFGFSDSGMHLAVAVGSHTLELYGR